MPRGMSRALAAVSYPSKFSGISTLIILKNCPDQMPEVSIFLTLRAFCLDISRKLEVACFCRSCYNKTRIVFPQQKREVASVELQHGMFTAKLQELEREYGRLQNCIRLLQEEPSEQLHQERERLEDECRERALLLDETVHSCRSPAMARLAQLQRDYGQQTQTLLQTGIIKRSPDGSPVHYQDDAEAMALYAEFAVDFATQSMRHALMAALRATELQIQADACTMEGDSNDE